MANDLELLKELEQEVGRKLPQWAFNEIIGKRNNGFIADDRGRVTGLNLDKMGLRAIPSALARFTHLERLSLYDNKISDAGPLAGLTNLTILDIRANKINEAEPLRGLTKLKELKLGDNRINDAGPLTGMTELIILTLYRNQISDAGPLARLTNLTELKLGDNRISDTSPITGLTKLAELRLNGNQIGDVGPLSGMTNLTELRLDNNRIGDVSPLSGMTNLTTLYLSANKISDPGPLSGMTKLNELWLQDNQLSDVGPLSGMTNLTTLYLSGNKISDVGPLSGMTNLTELYLNRNQISDPGPFSGMTNLTTLYLSDNQISDVHPLSGMINLTELSLSGNQISDVLPLSRMSNLNKLSLIGNQISDVRPLSRMTNLTELYLNRNQISDTSPITGMTKLAELRLNGNQISDVGPLSRMTNLRSLSLINNKIAILPPQILNLHMELDVEDQYGIGNKLYLDGNPLEQPPPEIIKQGTEAMRAYFQALEQEKQLPLREAKILLVGDGGAGKTSLVKCLLGRDFDPNEEQTHGINIDKWQVQNGADKIKAHLWDFGGQEIMHATHQFFLSKRSLYVLVLDGRRDEKTEYWLKHIESFGGDSPVLVALNKMDQHPSFDVNRPFLKQNYPNIKGFYQLACAKGEGIQAFKKALIAELNRVELIRTTWPESWFTIKTVLENMPDHYIDYTHYEKMCRVKKIADKKKQALLLEFLHDLGVALHFKDMELKDTQVLRPEWVTGAVYRIINSPELSHSKGVLDFGMLETILSPQKESNFQYPRHKYRYLTGLMEKFQLTYPLASSTQWLVPDLLAVPEPEFAFDYDNALRFIVEYDFLPRSVIPRFIVTMHKDIQDNLQWRTGVVLTDPMFQSEAVIKADYRNRRIYIDVTGNRKRDYLVVLLHNLHRINSSFEKLKTKELIPMPDNPDITVSYKQLVQFEAEGIEYYFTGESDRKYNVKELLGAITGDRAITENEIIQLLKKIATNTDTKESLTKKLNESFILQPQVLGVGINLNKIIDKVIGFVKSKKKRSVT